MLAHGAWSDYRNIPVLNSDKSLPMVTAADLRDYYYALVLAGVVNSAWKKQTTYIMCFPMTKDKCEALSASRQIICKNWRSQSILRKWVLEITTVASSYFTKTRVVIYKGLRNETLRHEISSWLFKALQKQPLPGLIYGNLRIPVDGGWDISEDFVSGPSWHLPRKWTATIFPSHPLMSSKEALMLMRLGDMATATNFTARSISSVSTSRARQETAFSIGRGCETFPYAD